MSGADRPDHARSDGVSPPGLDASLSRFRWQRRLWTTVSVVLALAGCGGAIVGARLLADRDAQAARAGFVRSAEAVDGVLNLEIVHETDLLVSAGGFFADNPTADSAQLRRWADSVQALTRYPEILGFGYSVIVPASKLAAFERRAVRDPAGTLPADGRFRVVPAGRRPYYCLAIATVAHSHDALPAGYDFCSGPLRQTSLASRDSGKIGYAPITIDGRTLFSVVAPIYRGGVTPRTVVARRAAFLGWVGMPLVPRTLLEAGLAAHPHLSVTVTYSGAGSSVSFGAGPRSRRGQSVTVEREAGWTVRIDGPAAGAAILAADGPATLLLGGIAASVLLGLLVFVLATGRARAWRLVALQTTELAHQALHDGLTGLPNRALITDRAEHLLARSRRHGSAGAVLFVDLDEFKTVNDALGHQAGDELLRIVAQRLVEGLREVDTVGRLGGDEFVVLLEHGSVTGAALVAERLLALMREPFILAGAPAPITLTASVGVAAGLRDSAFELLRDADMALYQAKARGKDGYEIFRPEMESALRHQLDVELELRSALERGELRLVYLPIYAVADLEPVGLEALLRWDHPRLGAIPPAEFVPLLEATDQIREVDRWVLATACEQIALWREAGGALGVGVNVSARSLEDDAIVDAVRDALARSGLDGDVLTIEIAEAALTAVDRDARRRLARIRELGVNVAIDDFGRACGWLRSLERYPVDAIKIDRMFTGALGDSREMRALMGAFSLLGRELGVRTLAVGVETIEALDDLRATDVDAVQGFLLSRPLDRERARALILPGERPTPPAVS